MEVFSSVVISNEATDDEETSIEHPEAYDRDSGRTQWCMVWFI